MNSGSLGTATASACCAAANGPTRQTTAHPATRNEFAPPLFIATSVVPYTGRSACQFQDSAGVGSSGLPTLAHGSATGPHHFQPALTPAGFGDCESACALAAAELE